MFYKDSKNISAIGIGTGGYFYKDADAREKQADTIRFGIDLGMTHIDTAEAYGNGLAEEAVGIAIKGIRDNVFVSTKVSPENLAYSNLLDAAEDSLKRLKTEYIDLYYIHWPNPNVPTQKTMSAMNQLLEEGKVRHIGVSNFSLKGLAEARAVSASAIFALQAEYNLLDRGVECGILPYCLKLPLPLVSIPMKVC